MTNPHLIYLLYEQKGITKKYLQETDALTANPDDPAYKTWTQVRKYGGWNKDYPRDGERKRGAYR